METKKLLNDRTPRVLLSILILVSLLLSACAAATNTKAPDYSPAVPKSGSQAQAPAQAPAPTQRPASPPAQSLPAWTTPHGISPAPYSNSGNIGLAVGGAKDVNNFRENINNNYLPLPTDITYEGLFYDYYFDTGDTGDTGNTHKLFYPSYSCAVTRDPFSRKTEYYLSVGLNSGLKEDEFARKKLNLVIVLDISGSMSSPFDEYYYDQAGHKKNLSYSELSTQKIEVAKDAIDTILKQLNNEDRLGIVLFNERAYLMQPMDALRRGDADDVIDEVNTIRASGSTNLSAGMQMATDLISKYRGADPDNYENRIIILTDAMPNTGEIGEWSMLNTLKRNAADHIYSTIIGVGVDFNTELIDYITKTRGANYYSVHTPGEFAERMTNFDHMVTPLVFNLKLSLDAKGWDIEKVYGSPEADKSTTDLMRVNTLFPSDKQDNETKGGLILLKLKKQGSGDGELRLRVTYEDRAGRTDSSESLVFFENARPEYFDNTGIRKGILLSRYADLMKDWLVDEREHLYRGDSWLPRVNPECGIVIPMPSQGKWERQSTQLTVASPYRSLFKEFSGYFSAEMGQIGDNSLDQELSILRVLGKSPRIWTD
jgi:Ca-activated chloride channel homolog